MRYVKQFVTEKSPRATLSRWIAVTVMLAMTTLYLSLPALAQTKYVITDGDHVIVCMSSSNDPAVVIEEAGLQLGESDTYTTQTGNGVSEITINRIQMITVQEGNETIVVGSYGGTVADVLASLDISLSDSDVLSCEPDTLTYDGMTVRLTRVEREILEYDQTLPFATRSYEDSSLEPGEQRVLIRGQEGLAHCRAQILYENGEEVQRDILSQQIVTAPTDEVILHGVDRSVKEQEFSGNPDYRQSDTSQKSVVLNSEGGTVPGTNLRFSQLLSFQATAYYCEPWESGITYTGTQARVGAIAVDPDIIPLGTKMYIVSADGEYLYGYCVAEDTGGAIQGNIVDLFFNTYEECIQFGRRDVLIYILD